MIISEKQSSLLNYTFDQRLRIKPSMRIENSVSFGTTFEKNGAMDGRHTVTFEVHFYENETNALLIGYQSLATMHFILEDENKDYEDYVNYLNDSYESIISFIKKNCLSYRKQLSVTLMSYDHNYDRIHALHQAPAGAQL